MISLVIPVFNMKQFLPRCMEKFLRQKGDYEIILIDDGSTDGSRELCDWYAAEYSALVRVVHKENGGLSSARNAGIDAAQGEYVIFPDPDDWVEPEMLEVLYQKAKQEDADMVICDYYFEGVQRKYMCQRPSGFDGRTVLCDLMFQKLHGSLWNKLIKRACYKIYGITLPKGLDYCEDVVTLVQLWQNPIKISYVNKAFYYYDQHINEYSITRAYTKTTYRMRCLYLSYLKQYLSAELYNKVYATQYSLVALEAFFKNVFSNEEFYEIYHGSIHLFLSGKIYWSNKLFLCVSAIGLKFIAYDIYLFLRKIKYTYYNIFKLNKNLVD